jgi:hypothetical protein
MPVNQKEEKPLSDITLAFASLAAATAQQLDPKLYLSQLRRIQKHMASSGETGSMYMLMMDRAISLIQTLPREEPPKRH